MKEEVEPCWIEIRPLTSGKFEVGCFASILDYLHNTGKPFRFCTVNCPSTRVEGLKCVKFFLQLYDAELAERVANVLKSSLDVEIVVGSTPPERIYSCCVELTLKSHHAVPVWTSKQRLDVNPVDVLVGALSGGDSAVEVLAVQDRKARLEILKYIAKLTGKSVSFAEALLNTTIDIPTSIFGPPPSSKPKPKELNPVTREKVESAGWKANQNLLRCEVRLYGDRKTVETLRDALPSTPMNSFRVAKRLKASFIDHELRKPGGRELGKQLLSCLWILPVALFFAAWLLLGAIDPLRLSNADLTAMALTLASALALWMLFQKRPPLVLSTGELSLIAGLPTAVGRLPVETGTARMTRGQFTFGETPSARPPDALLPEAPPMVEELKVEGEASVKASAGKPVKVAGVLKDPETGAPLPEREFEVYDAEGKRLYADFSDAEGSFSFIYTPEKAEAVRLEIRAKGFAKPSHIVEISAEG